jgi:glutamyl-tRNA synthetase
MSVRVRYAPSPTGSPHVGNVRTAIFNWLFARKHGGIFIARLEDTDRDPERYKPATIGDIEQSLRHLGIEPDEWWISGGPAGPYVQSERLYLYKQAADELIAKGHAYQCYCTAERLAEMRAEQQARGGSSGYDRRCRRLTPEEKAEFEAQGLPYTVRLAVPLEGKTTYKDLVYGDISFENRLIDDQVLLKSNGWPTYHLAVVVDDHHMGVTHVLRGEDWQPSTPKQILLYQMFGWEAPQWAHLPLIVGTDRKKLSKRHGSTQFVEFVSAGYLPEALFNFLILLGWSAGEESRELFTREEILERFDIGGVTNHPAIFDYEKLRWMNGEYIRSAQVERITDLCLPYLQEAGLISTPLTEEERTYAANVIPLVVERMKVLSEVAPSVEFFFVEPEQPEEKGRRKWLTGERATELLDHSIAAFSAQPGGLTVESAEAVTNAVAEAAEVERGRVIHTLRIATTGRTVGPGLFETLAVLGKERVIMRLERAKSWVTED